MEHRPYSPGARSARPRAGRPVPPGLPDAAAAGASPFSLIAPGDVKRLPSQLADAYPLTHQQAHICREPSGSHVTSALVRAPFHPGLLRRAVRGVIERQPALRTSLDLAHYDEPLQLVHREADLPVAVRDLRGIPEDEQDRRLRNVLRKEGTRSIDTSQPPLFRLRVHRRTDDTFQWTLSAHPAATDIEGVRLLSAELLRQYRRLLAGEPPSPPDATPSTLIRDVVGRERAAFAAQEERDHWTGQYRGYIPVPLPRWPDADRQQRTAQGPDASARRVHQDWIPAQTLRGLRLLAARLGVPIRSVLLAAHVKVMATATGDSDVVTGISVGGSPKGPCSAEALGMVRNTPPLRIDTRGGTWSDLVRRTQKALDGMLPHCHFPSAGLQRLLGVDQLFDHRFSYDDLVQIDAGGGYSEDRPAGSPAGPALCAAFVSHPNSSRVLLRIDSSADRVADRQDADIRAHYLTVLAAMAAGDDSPHESLPALDAAGLRDMAVNWQGPERAYPVGRCVHELVEDQVRRTPHAVAVVDDRDELTFAQLNARANRLAHELRRRGAGPETVIGVCGHRDVELVVSLLGILKSGAAYVPLEPDHPLDRMDFVLRDSGARMVLTRSALAPRIPAGTWELIDTEAEAPTIAAMPSADLPATAGPDNLMYVIYTSGSTGRPKGVLVPHSGVVNYLGWCAEGYARGGGTGGAPVFSSIAFDMVVPNLYTPLVMGERLCVLHDTLDVPAIAERLAELAPFTFIKMTPGHLDLLGHLLGPEQASRLADVLAVGADTFPTRVLDHWRTLDPVTPVLNEYGPTEASVGNSVFVVDGTVPGDQLPIGRAIPNTTMYVLDDALNHTPVGVPGELYIGGSCVVRGYAGRPALTAERFVADPFTTRPGSRLYRTGDRGRWLPDGQLQFLGRNDDQVKVNGHRVELGELEAVLAEHPLVAQSVATVVGAAGGYTRLVGYYVPAGDVDEATLLDYLIDRLPAYMVPGTLVPISTLPLNSNGKVDRKALPSITKASGQRPPTVLDPDPTTLEALIADAWKDVLGARQIGPSDNFFALGGTSLLATQLALRLQAELGLDSVLSTILSTPTLADLTAALAPATADLPVGDTSPE